MEGFALRILGRLLFRGAEGGMRSVLDFTKADAEAAYRRRVVGPREQAAREEPFWLAVAAEAPDDGGIRSRPKRVLAKIAKMAVASGLTSED